LRPSVIHAQTHKLICWHIDYGIGTDGQSSKITSPPSTIDQQRQPTSIEMLLSAGEKERAAIGPGTRISVPSFASTSPHKIVHRVGISIDQKRAARWGHPGAVFRGYLASVSTNRLLD